MKNLSKANKLIEDIAKKDKRITPITPKDLPLFQKFFKKEPHTYGNSWTYVTQGMYGIGPHGLGYKYYDGKNLSAVAIYPKIEQPDIHCFYWVRPMGQGILDVIDIYAKNLLKIQSIPTYVKKIFKNQFDYLCKKGFKDTSKFPWHTSCPSEDDTYSEQIYEVKKTLLLLSSPPRTSNIRKSYRKSMHIEKDKKIIITDNSFEEVARKVTKDFFNSEYIKNKKVNVSDENDYYNPIFANKKNNALIKKFFYINNIPLAYFIGERQKKDYTSIYVLISLRDRIQYLSDYVYFKLLEISQTKYLNLGGSEDEGIHKFKKKFKPVRSNKMYWATYHNFSR
ncbi:hypothetical protein HY041_00635 [Candidatus Roizmanbacteria bacterium]|nr:hypothetical protein [Candidatus Roizmanbacteria bacterium]